MKLLQELRHVNEAADKRAMFARIYTKLKELTPDSRKFADNLNGVPKNLVANLSPNVIKVVEANKDKIDTLDLGKWVSLVVQEMRKLEEMNINENVLDDDKIMKFITDALSIKIKSSNYKKIKYIKFSPTSIQLVEDPNTMNQFPYMIFKNGNKIADESVGVGYIGLTIPEFIKWLESKGVTQAKKPAKLSKQTLGPD